MGSVQAEKKLLEVFTDNDLKNTKLPMVAEFLSLFKKTQRRAKVLVVDIDPQAIEVLNRRRHDLQSAIRTLVMASNSLSEGYRFDDTRGKSKIAAVAKAVKVIESEGELALEILEWQ